MIDATEGYRCTGRVSARMEDALARIGADLPDVALVDIGLPGMSGIEGIRILKERFPSMHALMLTVYDDDERIFDALCAGATGYLLKKTPQRSTAGQPARGGGGGLADVPGGGPPGGRAVPARSARRRAPTTDLTPHETRILRMFMEGHNYKTAAAELKVSVNTVAFHVKNIYSKLQVHSKSEAVAKALKAGLIR